MRRWTGTPESIVHECTPPSIDRYRDGAVIHCSNCGQYWKAIPTADWSEWIPIDG